MPDLNQYKDQAVGLAMEYVPKFALALLTLFIGLWLIRVLTRGIRRACEAKGFDATLTPFLVNVASWILKAALLVSVAQMIGIQTTSLVAILGALGLAVGLALQGSLSNFAGGVLILIFRPYKVGDFIKTQGEMGTVKEIQIFTTTLTTPQNRRLIIPNGPIANNIIQNFSAEDMARVDMVFGIAYEADVEKAKGVLMKMLEDDPRVLKEPAPVVAVVELADSSVNLVVRPHVATSDYWDVHFAMMERGKALLEGAGISIPFPQRDVHLYQHSA